MKTIKQHETIKSAIRSYQKSSKIRFAQSEAYREIGITYNEVKKIADSHDTGISTLKNEALKLKNQGFLDIAKFNEIKLDEVEKAIETFNSEMSVVYHRIECIYKKCKLLVKIEENDPFREQKDSRVVNKVKLRVPQFETQKNELCKDIISKLTIGNYSEKNEAVQRYLEKAQQVDSLVKIETIKSNLKINLDDDCLSYWQERVACFGGTCILHNGRKFNVPGRVAEMMTMADEYSRKDLKQISVENFLRALEEKRNPQNPSYLFQISNAFCTLFERRSADTDRLYAEQNISELKMV